MNKIEYTLPPLPYAPSALAPVISEEIMTLHHDKHHNAYVTGANGALEKLSKSRAGEIEIDEKAVMRDLSFNLNGHLLHSIFWKNLRPATDDNKPGEKVLQLLSTAFGSYDAFVKEFSNAAKKVEGSGWAMLAADYQKNLIVMQLEKHNLLGVANFKPVLLIDVWEHAYYLDYKNDRAAYVDAFFKIVNWDDVERRLLGCECCKDHECKECDSPDGCCGEC